MRKTLIALAAGLMAASALPAAASDIQARPYTQDRDHDRGRQDNDWNNGRHNDRNDDRWGRWDNRWGGRPTPPPRHWTRASDWYRHVHACQVRYRSYNPRTDTYVVRRGVLVRCRL